ncbi:UDP-glycosyltransferase 90A1 [Striga hermonthica]|uniref:UDP-glycosyltransferase 90A1 n=1 Tax=Striga hermonthica TaxID=68872 RepID=A0A9N7RGG7_STRHE|nr:UDP-glycosyltransferase 90A1 [Striga hermonthica]
MSHHATVLSLAAAPLLSLHSSPDQEFPVPGFPSITLCRNDFDRPFTDRFPTGPHWDFILESGQAMAASFGMIVNSFYDMEKPFADHLAARDGLRCYTVGPLCLAGPPGSRGTQKPRWIEWLDEKNQTPVLYIAFGSQAEISPAQLREIANGLESSNARFLWVVRKDCDLNAIDESFEERVKGKGIIVNEWVDQREILEHPAVQGFLSHCGWNSVLEGICAEVPILAWPMMAEQYLNAKFVTEEIGIGLRVSTVDGTRKGFVAGENLRSAVVELMEGENGKRMRDKVKEVAKEARKAVAEEGSSWLDLNRMIKETCKHAKVMSSYVE